MFTRHLFPKLKTDFGISCVHAQYPIHAYNSRIILSIRKRTSSLNRFLIQISISRFQDYGSPHGNEIFGFDFAKPLPLLPSTILEIARDTEMCILGGGVVNGGVNGLESRCQHAARRKAARVGCWFRTGRRQTSSKGREGFDPCDVAMCYVRSIFFSLLFFLFLFISIACNVFSRVKGLAVIWRRGEEGLFRIGARI